MRRLPPLNALRSFEVAARHESFTRAADELCVTAGAVSQQVKALEEDLGIKLFTRQPQGLIITDAGRDYLEIVRDALDRISIGTERLLQKQRNDVLSVSVSRNFASKWLVQRLGKLTEAFPGLDLRISAASHHVDFAREDVDVAVRNTSEKQSGLEMIRLHDEELFPVCSPDLLKGKHPLNSPEDIVHHTLLHLDNRQDWFKWLERAGLKDWDTGRVDGPILNQVGMTIDAAVDGQGIALARTALVINDLTSGRLIRPFNLSLPVSYAYWLVYPKVSESLPKIQAFRDWVKNEVEEDKRFLAQMKGA